MKNQMGTSGIWIIVLFSITFAWQSLAQGPHKVDSLNFVQSTKSSSENSANEDVEEAQIELGPRQKERYKSSIGQSANSHIFQNYLGSTYKGNYVWGGAMNLAWNELNENILREPLRLNTKDRVALEMVRKLNNAPFFRKNLDEESYYIKSGYGQKTVEEINRESRKKFPSKSFEDLKMNLGPKDIISYAYFLKEIQYKTMFKKTDVSFNNRRVKGFVAEEKKQRENVQVIRYESDDKFIVKLKLKDKNDELILAKGYDIKHPQMVLDEISKNNKSYFPTMRNSDRFEAPKLHLDHHRKYVEIMGKSLANKGFEGYFISQMFENIKFDMDEKGARVENEGVIATEAFLMEPEKSRNFSFE